MSQKKNVFDENDIDDNFPLDISEETEESNTIAEDKRCLITNNDITVVMKHFCIVKEDTVFLDYLYFKSFANKNTYSIILQIVTSSYDAILSKYPMFNLQVNINGITFSDIHIHHKFILFITKQLKERYPQKLNQCFIFNAPKSFVRIYRLISMFVESDTLKKIHIL
jgi:CRAL/TRIO domain